MQPNKDEPTWKRQVSEMDVVEVGKSERAKAKYQ